MTPLKVACIGTGYFAQFHYQAWQKLSKTLPIELVAVIDKDLAKAEKTAAEFRIPFAFSSLKELDFIQVDLIDIITPPQSHQTLIKQALELDANIICQKPFCENYKQAKNMVDLAKQKNQTLVIHENFRFMPWHRKLKELLSQNLIGDVLNTSFKFRPGDGQGKEAYLERQPYFQKMPKFLVHETAIHIIDVFRYLFGEISEVSAQLRQCNPVINGEDSALISFEFKKGMSGLFDGNRCLDHAASNHRRTMGEMWIEGTKGCLRLDGEARIWHREFQQIEEKQIDYAWQDIGFGGDCVYLTTEHICQHFINGTKLENNGFEYLKNIKIEDAVYKSSKDKRVIAV